VSERAIGAVLDALDATIEASGLGASDVDLVCLTGGTSRMPLAADAIGRRVPRAGVRRLRSFHSVVQGLARRAREVAEA
jgi:hypothetical chaperone protein